MRNGEKVEVFCRFTDSWAAGFVIHEVVEDGFRLRRSSDGSLLPGLTGLDDLRPLGPA